MDKLHQFLGIIIITANITFMIQLIIRVRGYWMIIPIMGLVLAIIFMVSLTKDFFNHKSK